MSRFVETKRTLDGRVQTFQTRLLVATRRMAAVRFDFTGTTYATAGGFPITPGSFTTGFFWRDRTYALYHITDAGDTPIADRFDVVEGVRIRSDGLEYTDLLLDLWVSPLGRAHFEDEEEVEEYRQRGLVTDRQLLTIQRTARYLKRDHRRIVSAALAELKRRLAAME